VRSRRICAATAFSLAAIVALALAASPASAKKIEHAISPQAPLTEDDYELMSQAGVDMLRLSMGWGGIQAEPGACTPTGGACDWSFQDRQIGEAASHGIEVMSVVYGSAPFVNSEPKVPPTKDLSAWAQFARAAAQRYGPGGAFWQGPYQELAGAEARAIPVRHWQIWNEPSSFQFFKPKPNTKKYARILKPAGRAIKSADEGSTVVLGGVFGEPGPKGTPLGRFFKQLYKTKKVKSSFDAVAIHPYAKKPKGLLKQTFAIRKATRRGNDRKAKVWVTELGYSSGCQGCPKGNMPPVATKNEKAQAKALARSYRALMDKRTKLNLGGIVWFSWQDVNSPDTCRFCRRAGLVDVNGKPKTAFRAYRKAAR
jgi:hypothetical protein